MIWSRGMGETPHTSSVLGIGMRAGRVDRWAPPFSRPIAVPSLTPEAHMAATPREWFAQFLEANPIARPALIIVDPRWPGHLAAMRNGFADHPLVHVVPDLRQAERRHARATPGTRERRAGPDRRSAPPRSWTHFGVVVVPGAGVGPPMEP